jgi:hypothetical protein
MFKTIKIPIIIDEPTKIRILDLQRQYSNVVHSAYNRFVEGHSEKEIRSIMKNLNSIEHMKSWLVQCAIMDAKAVFTRFNLNKDKSISKKQILFGGKVNLNKLHKKLITKEEYKLKRLRPIDIQGELIHSGNRMFNLRILEDNKVIMKVSRKVHLEINLPKLKKNLSRQLNQMQELAENKQLTYSVKLTSTHIYFSFDVKEEVEEIEHLENRCLGIDMNPNFIGVSILEFAKDNSYKVLESKCFDISRLTKKTNKSSKHPESIYQHNKLQHETIEITKSILNFAKSWNVKFVYFEQLNFKQGDSNKQGKEFNRLTRNQWLKGLFQEQLKKRLNLFGFKHFNINPAYSSVIGNLQHDYVDPVNAAIEIARRGQEVIINKTKKFYPEVRIKELQEELWKQTHVGSPEVWEEVFKWLKNSGVRYRVSLQECKHSCRVFQQNSTIKSKVLNYCFYE